MLHLSGVFELETQGRGVQVQYILQTFSSLHEA